MTENINFAGGFVIPRRADFEVCHLPIVCRYWGILISVMFTICCWSPWDLIFHFLGEEKSIFSLATASIASIHTFLGMETSACVSLASATRLDLLWERAMIISASNQSTNQKHVVKLLGQCISQLNDGSGWSSTPRTSVLSKTFPIGNHQLESFTYTQT